MPFRDGTGPKGEGAMTGKGRGNNSIKKGLIGSLLVTVFGFIKYDLNTPNSLIKTFVKNKLASRTPKNDKNTLSHSTEIIDAEYNIIDTKERE